MALREIFFFEGFRCGVNVKKYRLCCIIHNEFQETLCNLEEKVFLSFNSKKPLNECIK